jgi:hypothetical protein
VRCHCGIPLSYDTVNDWTITKGNPLTIGDQTTTGSIDELVSFNRLDTLTPNVANKFPESSIMSDFMVALGRPVPTGAAQAVPQIPLAPLG